ncbi:biotin--[acetyl-CoA-carboxylase] ligase [Tunturiibacter empetritectus]|uniref:biotin--[biotin carboxyl-carrier protein] ligase n=2 Tax=Tunturiibacter TaxID=3154218 RepID=A0A852V9K7_9BACT|nr:BirA family biotin operon repressor/biotin-[acetyl-CoA-carboxylase] ligase [Edaphobacter lichenicola]
MADSFDLSSIVAALARSPFAGHLQHLPTVGSTNLLALEAAQAGASHGSVWVADEQTAGRGRGGNTWHSIPGDGLYLSVLLRPQIALVDALWLSLATGLAAQAAIAAVTGLRPDIRWPNDLLLDEKKCGGILVETSSIPSQSDTPTMLRYAVIGIGINVNHSNFPAEIEPFATSLRREGGSSHPRERVLIELLRALDEEIHLLEDELREASTRPSLLERFEAASSWVRGKRVRVDEDGGYTGVTTGLDPRGFLRIAGDDGELHTVLSGGVRPF